MRLPISLLHISSHFDSYKESRLRGTWRRGRNSGVKYSQLSWAGQYKKCVQYAFKCTSVYSDMYPYEWTGTRLKKTLDTVSPLSVQWSLWIVIWRVSSNSVNSGHILFIKKRTMHRCDKFENGPLVDYIYL